jgi:hypothetical protein
MPKLKTLTKNFFCQNAWLTFPRVRVQWIFSLTSLLYPRSLVRSLWPSFSIHMQIRFIGSPTLLTSWRVYSSSVPNQPSSPNSYHAYGSFLSRRTHAHISHETYDFPTFFCLDENGNDGAQAVMTWYLPLLPWFYHASWQPPRCVLKLTLVMS